MAKSNTGSIMRCFKFSSVTFNFYPNTKTLQILGSACIEVGNHLEEVVSHLKPKDKESEVAIFIEDTSKDNAPVNGLMKSNGSLDTSKTDVPANGSNGADLSSFDSEHIRNEFPKRWTVVNFIHSKVESPAEHCQTATLVQEIDEYKLKCSMYEEKIQSVECERASFLEALRILSTEDVTALTIVVT